MAQLSPSGSAVVALVCAFGDFHLAQQGVHFCQRELAVGAYRTVTGHGSQHIVTGALQHMVGIVLGQLSQYATRQGHRIALCQ
jgi:predicted RNA binding protein YcfA (HicA-like mRNA interferase family)